jgi:hypothetical protein
MALMSPLASEQWVSVVGFEAYYEVSDSGRVRRVAPGRRTKPGLVLHGYLTNGYPMVKLFDGSGGGTPKARVHVHRLVARAFLGPCPEGHEVNHKDGSRINNKLDNLEYVTHSENILHAVRIGRKPQGERVPNSKLTAEDVRAMRALRTCGWPHRKLAKAFGVSLGTVGPILSRKWWKGV